jgi:hypothetical protein
MARMPPLAFAEHILAVDPGVGGGMALYRQSTDKIILRKWTTESEYLEFTSFMGSGDRSATAVIEDVPAYVAAATSNASSFKLGFNYGFHVGAMRALGVPVHLIGPKKWQKGLRGLKPNMGTTARKRTLKDNAIRLYPDQEGIINATADALLILDWWLTQ